VFDKAGNLYYGASTDGGMVYRLAPPAKQGDPWTESVLYVFPGKTQGDGSTPSGGLVMDSVDNLYGMAQPPNPNGGTVFTMSP
jgi:hypothetical protein